MRCASGFAPEPGRLAGRRKTDGDITLDLTQKKTIDKGGIQYFGVQVENRFQLKSRFNDVGLEISNPEAGQSEVRFNDPEGNVFAVSEKGWQL